MVIGGGQSGADIAGWESARRFGLLTGGCMPRGYLTEDGPRPEYARLYGAREIDGTYRDRTIANVGMADCVIWFGSSGSPGGMLTFRETKAARKPIYVGSDSWRSGETADKIRAWRQEKGGDIRLMIAGNRESSFPGMERLVKAHMIEVYREIGYYEWEGK
jgi:hypothetical protein